MSVVHFCCAVIRRLGGLPPGELKALSLLGKINPIMMDTLEFTGKDVLALSLIHLHSFCLRLAWTLVREGGGWGGLELQIGSGLTAG